VLGLQQLWLNLRTHQVDGEEGSVFLLDAFLHSEDLEVVVQFQFGVSVELPVLDHLVHIQFGRVVDLLSVGKLQVEKDPLVD